MRKLVLASFLALGVIIVAGPALPQGVPISGLPAAPSPIPSDVVPASMTRSGVKGTYALSLAQIQALFFWGTTVYPSKGQVDPYHERSDDLHGDCDYSGWRNLYGILRRGDDRLGDDASTAHGFGVDDDTFDRGARFGLGRQRRIHVRLSLPMTREPRRTAERE